MRTHRWGVQKEKPWDDWVCATIAHTFLDG
jgi:hypothetical protein